MWSHVFFSAPHRVFFAGGLIQVLLALGFWCLELAVRLGGASLPWSLPATWLHGGMMLYGLFTWFILGFLTTALPKWMNHGPLVQAEYLPPFLLLALGALVWDLGLLWPRLILPGTLLSALGLLLAAGVLLRVTLRSEGGREHALLVLVTLVAGAIGLVLHGLAVQGLDVRLQAAAVVLGVWCFLLPLFFIVLHRMLPFFVASTLPGTQAWRPLALLYLMLACLLGHGLLQLAGWNTAVADLPAFLVACVCLVRWGFRRSLGVPMLAMLHWGWAWACLALGLQAMQSLLQLGGMSWGGLAPLHALGLGFFLSVLMGMGTRVTRGHSGRPIAEDAWGWRCFLVLQGAVVLRLLGEFLPLGGLVNFLAVLVASAAFLLWAAIHGPMYYRARPDGQPG